MDHQDAKIDPIGPRCVALSAGNALCVQDVLIGGIGAAHQLQNPTVHQLAEHIKHQFCEVRKRRVNDVILGPRGLNFDEFYRGGLISQFPRDLSVIIDGEVTACNLGTSFLVAGVDGTGAHIYCVDHPGTVTCFDRVGYHAIGIGDRHAVLKLVALGQHHSKPIRETIFNVYCAKRVSELAPGVGRATSMKVVSTEGTESLSEDVLKALEPTYQLQADPVTEEIKNRIEALPYGQGGRDGPDEEAA